MKDASNSLITEILEHLTHVHKSSAELIHIDLVYITPHITMRLAIISTDHTKKLQFLEI